MHGRQLMCLVASNTGSECLNFVAFVFYGEFYWSYRCDVPSLKSCIGASSPTLPMECGPLPVDREVATQHALRCCVETRVTKSMSTTPAGSRLISLLNNETFSQLIDEEKSTQHWFLQLRLLQLSFADWA